MADTDAGYIVFGNYPDIGNNLKYGELVFVPKAPRNLFGENA